VFSRWLDSPWPYFAGAGILFILAVASQFEFRLPSRPTGSVEDIVKLSERDDLNILFLLVDTLRSDRLGLQGYQRPTTPNLSALARQGIVFENNVAQSTWTKTSMVSLWTGTLPANHGVLRYNHVIPEEATMPAEILKEQGFRTAGVWRNGWVAPNFGFRQGFEVYYRPKAGRERAQIQRANPSSHPLQGTDEDLLVSAKEFLSNFGKERFFLYLHFMDVHQYLYDESSAQFGTSYSDAYDQSILWTDRIIGELMNTLEKMDLSKNTLVVLASDHGEAFREHGWEGHAKNLHEEVVHVPFVILPPFRLDPGIVVDARVSNVDIWPTILDMLGLPPLPATDGASALPLILEAGGLGPQETAEALRNRVVIGQLDRYWGNPRRKSYPIVSVTDGSMRFFLYGTEPPREELFDRTADPGEQTNLIANGADPNERAIAMRKMADDYLANRESPWGVAPVEVELGKMQLDQLRALGYVIEGR
jgi:arylsulfatase A-like enzyme